MTIVGRVQATREGEPPEIIRQARETEIANWMDPESPSVRVVDRDFFREHPGPVLRTGWHFERKPDGSAKERSEWLGRLKKMLKDGIRSEGWDFTSIVERAKDGGHSATKWLGKLAAVIADDEEIISLNKWKTWKDAE